MLGRDRRVAHAIDRIGARRKDLKALDAAKFGAALLVKFKAKFQTLAASDPVFLHRKHLSGPLALKLF